MKAVLGLVLLMSLQASASFTAHEWGTFTSLMGSNGERQHGMYHEDEHLPLFVHQFGEDLRLDLEGKATVARTGCSPLSKVCDDYIQGNTITQKMETPVLYFYSNTKKNITVDVGFPGGVLAQSFPKATFNFPKAVPGVMLKNGFSHYNLEITELKNGDIPFVEPKNIYIHARNVNSNIIKMGNEKEKFIFYRGVGDFETNLTITSQNSLLNLINKGDAIKHIFLLNVQGEQGAITRLSSLNQNQSLRVDSNIVGQRHFLSKKNFTGVARKMLIESLINSGLYQDEAEAMINTWEESYLKSNGLRVLYVLHPSEVERILPMNITPAPSELTRVFIGRIEILTENEENRLIDQITKEGEGFKTESLGRLAHPILERLLKKAQDNKHSSSLIQTIIKALAQF